jgi:hypothetical protein
VHGHRRRRPHATGGDGAGQKPQPATSVTTHRSEQITSLPERLGASLSMVHANITKF